MELVRQKKTQSQEILNGKEVGEKECPERGVNYNTLGGTPKNSRGGRGGSQKKLESVGGKKKIDRVGERERG